MLVAADNDEVIIALAYTLLIFLLILYAAAECLAQGSYLSGVMFHYASLLIVLKIGSIPNR